VLAIKKLDLGGISVSSVHVAFSIVRQSGAEVLFTALAIPLTAGRDDSEIYRLAHVGWGLFTRIDAGGGCPTIANGRFDP
jgi:hypothetical protein